MRKTNWDGAEVPEEYSRRLPCSDTVSILTLLAPTFLRLQVCLLHVALSIHVDRGLLQSVSPHGHPVIPTIIILWICL